MTKLELIARCMQDDEIADWYAAEHGIKLADMTSASVRTFGTGGHGDIANSILEDGLRAGIITQAEYENA